MRNWIAVAVTFTALGATPVVAKKRQAAAGTEAKAQAAAAPSRAIGELAGKFKWGLSSEDAIKIVADDTIAKFDERIKKEKDPFRQDKIHRELNEAIDRIKDSYIKFDGQKTGWDVSLIDREFAHNNDESMLVIWEANQRRFLFFYQNKLWKQFIAFNADHPAFAGKTFDDFGALIQKRYGQAQMSFRKQRSSDEQTFDHLEWPPTGDYLLWAIDQTILYNNFCLSLSQKSLIATIEKGREEHSPRQKRGSSLVDAVTQPADSKADENADIVDEITGRQTTRATPSSSSSSKPSGKGKDKKKPRDEVLKGDSTDPLQGTNM